MGLAEPSTAVPSQQDTGGRFGERSSPGLRARTARGSVINGMFVVGTTAISALQTVIVARLLPTAVFGRWGLLMAAFMTTVLLTSVGVDDKYIQQDESDQEHAFQVAFTLILVLGAVLVVMILVGTPLLAFIYGRPDIIVPGLALSAAVPAMALGMPLLVHYRRLDFARQRKLQLVDPVVTFLVTIALAVAGLGLWALVLGATAGTWAAGIVIARSSPYPIRLCWDRTALTEYRRFSMPLFFSAIATVLLVQAPVTVGSRVLGVTAVAGIVLANNVSSFTTQVDAMITQTLYPVICAVKDRPGLLLESFWKSNRLALLWAAPVGGGVALFAGDFVHFVIGEKWRFAAPLIAVVGVNAVINQIGFNWTAFFRALGDTRPVAICSGIGLAAMLLIAVPLLATDGLTAFAIGLGIVNVIGVAARLWFLRRIFPGFSFVAQALWGVGPTLPAVACVLLLRFADPGEPTFVRVAAEAVMYASLVVACTYASDRRLLRESAGYLRRPPLPQASI